MLVEHVVVDYLEREGAGYVAQLIAGRELLQVAVGMGHKVAKGVALGHGAELLAVGRAKHGVEPCPLAGIGLGGIKTLLHGLGTLAAVAVRQQAGVHLRELGGKVGQALAGVVECLLERVLQGGIVGTAAGGLLCLSLFGGRGKGHGGRTGGIALQSLQGFAGLLQVVVGHEAGIAQGAELLAQGFPVGGVGEYAVELGKLHRRVGAVKAQYHEVELLLLPLLLGLAVEARLQQIVAVSLELAQGAFHLLASLAHAALGGTCGSYFGLERLGHLLGRGVGHEAAQLLVLFAQRLACGIAALAACRHMALLFGHIGLSILYLLMQQCLLALSLIEHLARVVPVGMQVGQAQTQPVGIVLPLCKPAREGYHLVEVGVQFGAGAV